MKAHEIHIHYENINISEQFSLLFGREPRREYEIIRIVEIVMTPCRLLHGVITHDTTTSTAVKT
jgi:hypothetical protein